MYLNLSWTCYAFTALCFLHRPRTSELTALLWVDIDWVKKEMRTSWPLTQASKEPDSTVTTSGTRRVKLLSDALFAQQQQKRFTFLVGEQVFHHVKSDQQWFADQAIRKALLIHALTTTGVR